MKHLKEFYEIIDLLRVFQSDQFFNSHINQLSQLVQTSRNQLVQTSRNQQNASFLINNIKPTLDNIGISLKKIDITSLTSSQEKILEIYGFMPILGKNFLRFKVELIDKINKTPVQAQHILHDLLNKLNDLKNKPSLIFNQIQPLNKIENRFKIKENEGIIELVFDHGTKIDDFVNAKLMMNDWYLIIEGYSRLLNIQKTDFEIISITKSSPTKIKIKSHVANVALVLSIITSLLQLEQRVVGNRVLIENIKQNPITVESSKTYVTELENELTKVVENEFENIINKKLVEYPINSDADIKEGEVKNFMMKGINKQYNFIVNGGEVNVYLGEGKKENETLLELKEAKDEIKVLKEQFENLKKIKEKNK